MIQSFQTMHNNKRKDKIDSKMHERLESFEWRLATEIPSMIYRDQIQDVLPIVERYVEGYRNILGEEHGKYILAQRHFESLKSKLDGSRYVHDVSVDEEKEVLAANAHMIK
jgi:hypothetical protein